MPETPRPTTRRCLALLLGLALLTAGCVGLPDGGEPLEADQASPEDPTSENASTEDDGPASADGDGQTSSNSSEDTDDPAEDEASDDNATADEDPGPPANETQPRTVDHAMGSTTIEEPPARVVALEYNHVENLLALGIQPVGVANPDGYEKWVDAGDLDEDVVDVGTRAEPSLETIADLEPDLIVAEQFRHEDIHDELSDIAPTLVFDGFPDRSAEDDQFDRMQGIVNRTADATYTREEGREALAEMHATFDAGARALEEGGDAGREILLTQVFTTSGKPILRVFLDGSIPLRIAGHLGLENAWSNTECSQGYGFCTIDKEGLAHVQHADFFYQAQPDDDPVQEEWSDDPVWNSYEFVQEDRVYPLGATAWLFGGPLTAQSITERVVHHYR